MTLLNMEYQSGQDFKVDKYLVNKNRLIISIILYFSGISFFHLSGWFRCTYCIIFLCINLDSRVIQKYKTILKLSVIKSVENVPRNLEINKQNCIFFPLITLILLYMFCSPSQVHLSLLGFYPEIRQGCRLSINLLTLAGLSANILVDKPANLSRCTVKS